MANKDKIIDKIEKKIDSIEKLHDKESMMCEEVKDLLADLRDQEEDEKWEEILEKIYGMVVLKHQTCLGLVSNTFKSSPNDKVGSFSENTNFLFKTKINPKKHDLLI